MTTDTPNKSQQEYVMDGTEKKIGIIGIGNLICGDEGFGVHTIQYLENNYSFPENVILKDAGTAGIYMSPFLEECDPVLVIDVVDIDDEPGSVHFYDVKDVKLGNIQTKMSPHQLGLLEIIEICRLRDAAPENVEFYCAVPLSLETTMELSPTLAPRVKEVADMILKRVREMGVEVNKKNGTN